MSNSITSRAGYVVRAGHAVVVRAGHAVRVITAATAGLTLAVLTPVAAYAAGPISAADRDFLATAHSVVSLAVSASDLARTKASAGPVRTLGKKILQQDRLLDAVVKSSPSRLQVPLPGTPPSAVDKLVGAEGDVFDAGYVDRLRATDGTLLQLAAAARVNTRNDLVRDVAQRAMTTMAGQLPLLEGTGLVDFEALPVGPQPTPTVTARGGPIVDPGMLAGARRRTGFLWPSKRVNLAVLGSAALIAIIMAWRVRLSRRPRPAR